MKSPPLPYERLDLKLQLICWFHFSSDFSSKYDLVHKIMPQPLLWVQRCCWCLCEHFPVGNCVSSLLPKVSAFHSANTQVFPASTPEHNFSPYSSPITCSTSLWMLFFCHICIQWEICATSTLHVKKKSRFPSLDWRQQVITLQQESALCRPHCTAVYRTPKAFAAVPELHLQLLSFPCWP